MQLLVDQKSQNGGGLRATFRHNPLNHMKLYQESSAVLLISVGQQYHEGEKFAATINLINRSKFKKCFIMLGDSIQRYTMGINNREDLDKIHILANRAGDEWLVRNEYYYSKLKVPYEIIRWDRWLEHPLYQEYRKKLNELYQDNEGLRQKFISTINEFLDRHKKDIAGELDYDRAFKLCLDYLQEECTIIMPVWAENLYEFIIYPSKMLDAMQATYSELVKPYYPNVLYWLSLRFKRKESYSRGGL